MLPELASRIVCIFLDIGGTALMNKNPTTARHGAATLLLILLIIGGPALMSNNQTTAQQTTTSENEHIFMFNALWFKEDGGKAKYQLYLQAAGPLVAKYGGNSDASYMPEQAVIGEFDGDLVFIVEWPNNEAFTSMIQDPAYQAISHLRTEAISDSLLIRLRKL